MDFLAVFNPDCSRLKIHNFYLQDDSEKEKSMIYSVKVIKTQKRSDFYVQQLKSYCIFRKLEALKTEIKSCLDITPHQVGFIEPGHGLKGKNRWLVKDEDLIDMYSLYGKRKEVTLWCSCVAKKAPARKHGHGEEPPSTSKKAYYYR